MSAQTTEEILQKIRDELPDDFAIHSNDVKMTLLMQAADKVLDLPGTWILVNGEMTLLDLMRNDEKEKK